MYDIKIKGLSLIKPVYIKSAWITIFQQLNQFNPDKTIGKHKVHIHNMKGIEDDEYIMQIYKENKGFIIRIKPVINN